jgi:hypothetical protein
VGIGSTTNQQGGPGSLMLSRMPGGLAISVLLVLVAWPWLTLGALMIFQISIRRARLKHAHVMRCVLYSFDLPSCGLILLGCVILGGWGATTLLSTGWFARYNYGTIMWEYAYHDTLVAFLVISLAAGAYRFHAACKRYLRFDMPLATVLTTQILVLLGCLAATPLYGPPLVKIILDALRLTPRI